jgi:hypothetical protein
VEKTKVMAFDLDRFIGDCCAALSADPPQKAVRELVARAVSMPTAVSAAWVNRDAPKSNSSTTRIGSPSSM